MKKVRVEPFLVVEHDDEFASNELCNLVLTLTRHLLLVVLSRVIAPNKLNFEQSSPLRVVGAADFHVFCVCAMELLLHVSHIIKVVFINRHEPAIVTFKSQLLTRANMRIDVPESNLLIEIRSISAPAVLLEHNFTDRFIKVVLLARAILCEAEGNV